MNLDSVYSDGKGGSWHIGRLLTSTHPRGIRLVDVSALLTPVLQIIPWGQHGGTPGEIRQWALLGPASPNVDGVPISAAQQGHLDYVLGILEQIRGGAEPAPLILGFDGRLWDGLHRLIAYDLAGRRSCYAISFAESNDGGSLACSFDELTSIVDPRWLVESTLGSRQGEFWGAPGFPHLICDRFLSRDFAGRCYTEVLALRDWKRVVTDFYSQDEVVLELGDEGKAGRGLRTLVAAFFSRAMRRWICRCMGRVVDLTERPPTVVVHRMVEGDYIGVHNDYRPEGEAVRLVLFLGRESSKDVDDGVFVAMNRGRSEAVGLVPSRHNRLLSFGISDQSNHLVTEVVGESRYSIVFSYFLEGLP